LNSPRDGDAKRKAARKRKRSEAAAAPEEANETRATTFLEMTALWESSCRAGWAHLPVADRERFIEVLRRAKCRAHVDAAEFIQSALQGRQEILKSKLFSLASARGVSKSRIRQVIKERGYKSRRVGMGRAAEYLLNPNSDWKNELKYVRDAEIDAAVDVQAAVGDVKIVVGPMKSSKAEYYSDV
jgi:hypothetical protein